MYSPKNIEAVRDQMQQLDDIFKVMLKVQNITPCCQLKNKKEMKNGLMKLIMTSVFQTEDPLLDKRCWAGEKGKS